MLKNVADNNDITFHETPRRKKVVMVVEDETPLALVIKERLEQRGFETIFTASVNEARVYLEVGAHCDALWVDHYLKNSESGLVLVKWVREQEYLKDLPIFVVSNNASMGASEAYSALGITKQFTKVDTRLDEIIDEIERCIVAKAFTTQKKSAQT